MSSGNTGTVRSLSGRRILVVEDEYFLADDMAEALRSLGAEVVGPVAEVQEALKVIAATGDVSAAVLDINLRGELIYPMASELRRRKIPFVFATGYAQDAVASEYSDVPRWEKPFDPAALAKALPRLLS